jgi:hypothetical protein
MHHIDATALNVLVLIISTVGAYCVWWLKSFILFIVMTAALSSCSVVDYLGYKCCQGWAAEQEEKKRELEERKAERKRQAELAKQRPTVLTEFRAGQAIRTDVRNVDFNRVNTTSMRLRAHIPAARPRTQPVDDS